MIWMDVDTALAEVPVNTVPLTDDTDFKTIETAVAYNAAGMTLYWNFVTTAGAYTSTAVTPTNAGSYDWAHQNGGMYSIEIPASGGASINNDTEGFGYFSGVCTGVLPWRGPTIGFRAAALNDALIDGGDNLDVNVTQFGGTNATTSGGRPEVNTTHWAGTAVGSTTVRADLINISGAAVSTSTAQLGVNAVQAGGTAWGSGAITAASIAANAITSAKVATDAIGAAQLAADAVAEIADGVWDEATAGHTTAGSTGKALIDVLDDTGTSGVIVVTNNDKTGYRLSATGVDDVWDEATAGHAGAGTTGKALTDAGSAGDPWSTALPGAYASGTAGYIVGTNLDDTVTSRSAAATALSTVQWTNARAGYLDSLNTGVTVATNNDKTGYTASTVSDKTGYTLSATGSAAMTEGYAALGAAATLPQLLYEMRALLAEKGISSTTLTTKKLDGSTTAATYTLDDATTPTSITRAT